MKRKFLVIVLMLACVTMLFGCGGISGKFYRYYGEDEYSEDCLDFSGSGLVYLENGKAFACDYSVDGDYVTISIDSPTNPVRETFKYDKDEQTLISEYDIFKKK